MTLTQTYYVREIELGLIAGNVVICQITSSAPSPNNELIVNFAGGAPYASFTGLMSHNPTESFSTEQIATLLAAIGNNPGIMVSDQNVSPSPDPATVITYQAASRGAVRDAEGDSAHILATIYNALLTWESISASQGGIAEISCMLTPTYDGSNALMAFSVDQTCSVVGAVTEKYTLGPIYINNTLVQGVTGVNISSGVSVAPETTNGDTDPSYVAIQRASPTITFNTPDAERFANHFKGTAIDSNNVLIYLRKKSPDGGNVADGTGEHIKITVDDGFIDAQSLGGGISSRADAGIRVTPRSTTGEAFPLTFSTTSTIP